MDERNGVKLRFCAECGCRGTGSCNRAIEKDGSVRPIRDSGFRMKKAEGGA